MAAAGYQADPRSLVDGREALSQAIEDPLVVEAWSQADDEASYPEWAADSLAGWEDRARSLMAAGIPEPLAAKRSAMVFGSLGADGDFMAAAKQLAVDNSDLEVVADTALAKEFCNFLREPVQKNDPNWDESSVNRDPLGRFSEEEERGIMIDGKLYAVAEQAQAERKPKEEAKAEVPQRISDEALLASADELRKRREQRKRRKLARVAAAGAVQQRYAAEEQRRAEEQKQQAAEETEQNRLTERGLKRQQLRRKLRRMKLVTDTSASDESKRIDELFEQKAGDGTPAGEYLAQYQKVVQESEDIEYLRAGSYANASTMTHTQVSNQFGTGQQLGQPKLYDTPYLAPGPRKWIESRSLEMGTKHKIPLPVTTQNEGDYLGHEHVSGNDIRIAMVPSSAGHGTGQVIEADPWVFAVSRTLLNMENISLGLGDGDTEEQKALFTAAEGVPAHELPKVMSLASSWHMNRILEKMPENSVENDAYVSVSALMESTDDLNERQTLLIKYADLKNFMRATGSFSSGHQSIRLKNFYVLTTPEDSGTTAVIDAERARTLTQYRFVHHPMEEDIHQLAVVAANLTTEARERNTKSASMDEPVRKLEATWDETEVKRDELGRFAVEGTPDDEEARRQAYRKRMQQRNTRNARRARRIAAISGTHQRFAQAARTATAEERQDALLHQLPNVRDRRSQRQAARRRTASEGAPRERESTHAAREIEVISGKANNPVLSLLLHQTFKVDRKPGKEFKLSVGTSDQTADFDRATDDVNEEVTEALDRWDVNPNTHDAKLLTGGTFIVGESITDIDDLVEAHQMPEAMGTHLVMTFTGNGSLERPFELIGHKYVDPQDYVPEDYQQD
jgi:hypothetical protein